MKISHPALLTKSKAALLSLVSVLAVAACTRRSDSPQELPSGRYVQPEVPVTPVQSKSLSEELEVQISDSLTPIFSGLFEKAEIRSNVGQQQTVRLSRAMAVSFAKDITSRVQRSNPTHCVSSPDKSVAYLSCLLFEAIEGNLQNQSDAQRWLAGMSRLKDDVSGRMFFTDAEANDIAQSASGALVAYFSKSKNVESVLQRLVKTVDNSLRALEILSSQQASLDMPYLADSFLKDRRYVMTTSLQQGSVGSTRVFNLETMIVRLEINNNRLVVIRAGDGLYAGSSQEDLIVGSYPVVRTVQPQGNAENFYQVDFSRPENKSFLVSAFGAGEPSLQMSADVVVPRIAHAAKPVLGSMNNGLYFTKEDANLVIDQLVLINSNTSIFGDDEDSEVEPSKDPIRPTVHVVQGFFPLPVANDPFEMKQALPLAISQQDLRARGVKDLTDGKDVPYFSTKGMYEPNGGRARSAMPYVRKFNLDKEITFVLSRNVPAPVVPVLKSAVLSYKELFDGLATKDVPAPSIKVYTQDEFEELNRTQGLALGGSVVAADPRVSMIYWDDSLNLGSAWATAAENPRTGEIISGDVMLTGSMWAMEGCKGYFQRTWQKDKEPKLPNRPAGSVPSPVSRFLWEAKCDAALSNIGIFKSRAAQPANDPVVKDAKLAEFDRANRTGDLVTLANHASAILGRTVAPAEMASDMSESSAMAANQDGAALTQAYAKLTKEDGDLKKRIRERVASLETMLAKGDSDSMTKSLKSGRNVVNARLDCVRNLMPNADINLAEVGAPRIDSPFVNSPEAGALALLRSVVVHELGHVFGLRHNFIASTTPTQFAEDAKKPVEIDAGTDSIMDYNDYGIEMTSGAMRDFTSPEGAVGLGTFGAYDVVALATAYGMPTDAMKFKVGPSFCTDRNVSTFGNCQRFDFGKNYNEYLIHRINLILQRLRYANPLDAILDPRLPGVYAQLVSTMAQELLKVNALWGLAQSGASEASDIASKDALLMTSELAFRGVGAQQNFLKEFSKQHGVEPIATYGAMTLAPAYFANPAYGEVISALVRKEMDLNMIAVTNVLQSRAKSKGSDSAYLGVIGNQSHRGMSFNYQDVLLSHFGSRVVLPKGTASSFEYFYDGQRKDSSDATLDGKPYQLTLEKPLFNHQAQIVVIPNVVLDGPAPGSRKTVTALVKGQYSIEDMMRAIQALAAISVGNPLHPSQSLLIEQATALDEMLKRDSCAALEDDLQNTAACEALKAEARAPAAIVLNMIMAAAQGALPTSNVASGESF